MREKYRTIFIGILSFILLLAFAFNILAITGSFKPDVQSWTVQTLKEYMDQRFSSMQTAVTKAEEATEKRFESVNEFRTTLADQQRTFVPRQEYESGHSGLHTEVSELKERLDKIQNLKSGGNVAWAYLLSAVSLIVAVFSIRNNLIKK